jgi:hypothetical protein
MDLVPKKSNVASVLQCGGLWFGGKGWGLTWKLSQCVVKPFEQVSVFGTCHIQLSNDDISKMEVPSQVDEEETVVTEPVPISTEVDDSGDEAEVETEVETEPVAEAPKKKTVVKKAVVPEPEPQVEADAPKKKTVVKKKVVA